MFGKRTESFTPVLISLQSLASARLGIKKRIRREQNNAYQSDDPDYIKSRWENIRRLRIIRDELKKLEKEYNG